MAEIADRIATGRPRADDVTLLEDLAHDVDGVRAVRPRASGDPLAAGRDAILQVRARRASPPQLLPCRRLPAPRGGGSRGHLGTTDHPMADLRADPASRTPARTTRRGWIPSRPSTSRSASGSSRPSRRSARSRTPRIRIEVDGRVVEGLEGQTILEVCRDNGIEIPTLCYEPKLPGFGACRMCVVEVEGEEHPPISCSRACRAGHGGPAPRPRRCAGSAGPTSS